MYLSLDFQCDEPIYAQLARQIKFAVATGTLRTGQLIPSARTLSKQLAINPNTVVKTFSTLQDDHVIEPLRGRGMVVATGAAAACRRYRDTEMGNRITATLADAYHAGISRERIEAIVKKHLDKLGKQTPAAVQPMPPTAENS